MEVTADGEIYAYDADALGMLDEVILQEATNYALDHAFNDGSVYDAMDDVYEEFADYEDDGDGYWDSYEEC